ncbi:hypothetical protein TRIUR3_01924 [Triticum urartu]|uniref:Uncharacterized protein n=2 Tax=Triticum TaxID=4564 RepID=A0A9R0U247_TRITD|nr:hypothetical protein TRIUR3_01924 [Triticum urartu]VAI22678.1 unnamed protein product [Triticum turgidum subsp. durum]
MPSERLVPPPAEQRYDTPWSCPGAEISSKCHNELLRDGSTTSSSSAVAPLARLDGARKEIAFLYCAFFAFHAASVLLLFLSASVAPLTTSPSSACRRSWIPCLVSLLASLAMLWALRYKADTEAVLERVLAREQEDAALLGRCVAELKRKGLEFDLLKEVDALRRAKALRVEAKAGTDGPRRWPARDLPVFALFGAACGVLVLTRFLLCN